MHRRPTCTPSQVGKHPIQLYSLGTPNGVKVTILLEELVEADASFEYDAWLIKIDGPQVKQTGEGAGCAGGEE
jgi:GST-like protein